MSWFHFPTQGNKYYYAGHGTFLPEKVVDSLFSAYKACPDKDKGERKVAAGCKALIDEIFNTFYLGGNGGITGNSGLELANSYFDNLNPYTQKKVDVIKGKFFPD